MNRHLVQSEWVSELREFTQRNAGRPTRLEEQSPDIGVQQQESGYPLRGVAYDPRDHRVEIMVGDQAGTERHLTRNIDDAVSIDLLQLASGRDAVLRIAHPEGQTILRFQDD